MKKLFSHLVIVKEFSGHKPLFLIWLYNNVDLTDTECFLYLVFTLDGFISPLAWHLVLIIEVVDELNCVQWEIFNSSCKYIS